jgi:choline kinase
MYKVVIPCAGTGSRLGEITKNFNKAMVTIGDKPAICHIIDKFKHDIEFVIILGFKGDYLKELLEVIYPNRNFTFVVVDKYEGEGSGLGYSLNAARDYLQCPFIFTSNDTIVADESIALDPNKIGNWIGIYKNEDLSDALHYRTVEIVDNYAVNINPKGVDCENIYIGLAGIYDWKDFWLEMNDSAALTVGESYGLKALKNLSSKFFSNWLDTGNSESLKKTREHFPISEYEILEKPTEAIWFVDGNVIKFSIDEKFITGRIKRLEYLPQKLFPQIIHTGKNLYTYKMIKADIYSKSISAKNISSLLNLVQSALWSKRKSSIDDSDIDSTYKFYKDKTFQRCEMFFKMHELHDSKVIVNGISLEKIFDTLNGINWKWLCEEPIMSHFHGDFHNENILILKSGQPILLDWRQSFGDEGLEFGDTYYDFAKFLHGLIVSHKIINSNQYSFEFCADMNNIFIDINRPMRLIEAEEIFYEWLDVNLYNVRKVKILCALIYLNIAPLHEHHYSLFLFNLGRYLLHKWNATNQELI